MVLGDEGDDEEVPKEGGQVSHQKERSMQDLELPDVREAHEEEGAPRGEVFHLSGCPSIYYEK